MFHWSLIDIKHYKLTMFNQLLVEASVGSHHFQAAGPARAQEAQHTAGDAGHQLHDTLAHGLPGMGREAWWTTHPRLEMQHVLAN